MLNDEITLVTGASRGIGQAIALELGNQGSVVIGTATTKSGADKISQYLQEKNIKGCGVVLDLTDSDGIDAAITEITKEFGAISILINNAGMTSDNLFLRMKFDEWEKVINANLSGVFRVTKACIRPMLKARKGRVVNISSVVGVTGNPGQTNYSAAKAGILGFTKSLAKEIASRGITINAIAPGFIATDMTKDLPEDSKTALLAQIPSARLGEPGDIAHAVSFLVSNKASYITGETIHVNGGMLMD